MLFLELKSQEGEFVFQIPATHTEHGLEVEDSFSLHINPKNFTIETEDALIELTDEVIASINGTGPTGDKLSGLTEEQIQDLDELLNAYRSIHTE